MHPLRKQRLLTVIFIVFASSAGVALILFSLRENMNLFYPPSKIVAGEAPEGRTIRAGGCVVPGSVERDDTSLRVRFDVTDGNVSLAVTHEGILPDLFAEGEAAVLVGQLHEGVFEADEVLAKHDETYMPREVADSLGKPADKTYGGGDAATCEVIDYDA